MEGFCRGCLIKYDDPTEILHYTEKNRRLYLYSTGLQVKRNDIFPFQLCKDCYINMKMACRFKKLCRTSEKKIKNYLALKETGDVDDICSYLKNNDEDLLTFRFPLLSGNSTPARSTKEDDNESTCTSIRNFMTDILRADDIPDTEARIIREVIEEEADVLEESLDSHWLQDDVSIDTDFKLDFNYSPFTSPRITNGDRYTPIKQLTEHSNSEVKNREGKTAIEINQCRLAVKKILQNTETSDCAIEDYHSKDVSEINPLSIDTEERIKLEKEKILAVQSILYEDIDIKEEIAEKPINQNDRIVTRELTQIEKDLVDNTEENNIQHLGFYTETSTENDNNEIVSSNTGKHDYTIDKNLDEALKDQEIKEFPLDNILLTPHAQRVDSGPLTPTIKSILFGDNVSSQCIENFNNVEGNDDDDVDILEDFFKPKRSDDNEPKVINIKMESIEESEMEPTHIQNKRNVKKEDVKYNLDDFKCLTCDKKFRNIGAIKIHLTKIHKLVQGRQRVNKKVDEICLECGRHFTDYGNYSRHIKRHKNKKGEHECSHCLQKFSSESKLKMHMNIHGEKTKVKPAKYICPTCGAAFSTEHNLNVHIKRHNGEYRFHCQECDKKFYRSSDLTNHMRAHTGEKPFACPKCPYRAARRDTISRHINRHIDERRFKCEFCKSRFVNAKDLKVHHDRAKQCRKKQMHMALIANNKPNDFLVEEIRGIVIHNGNVENTRDVRGQIEKIREENEVTEECKITDLMSIPTIEENDSDGNVENSKNKIEDVRVQIEKIREETEKIKETEVTEECKITDLMSIPTIEENDSDLELPEESSTTDLQEEISQIISPVM